jgi:hypothetical protein
MTQDSARRPSWYILYLAWPTSVLILLASVFAGTHLSARLWWNFHTRPGELAACQSADYPVGIAKWWGWPLPETGCWQAHYHHWWSYYPRDFTDTIASHLFGLLVMAAVLCVVWLVIRWRTGVKALVWWRNTIERLATSRPPHLRGWRKARKTPRTPHETVPGGNHPTGGWTCEP